MLTRFMLCLIMHVLGFGSLSLSTSDNYLSIQRIVGVNVMGNAFVVAGDTTDLEPDMLDSGMSGKNVYTLAIISLGTDDSEIGIEKEDIIKVGLGIYQLLYILNRYEKYPRFRAHR